MSVKVLYVFVDILIDTEHFIATVEANFAESHRAAGKKLYLLSTIQFNSSIFYSKEQLEKKGYSIIIPQEKPRSAGEYNPYTKKMTIEQYDYELMVNIREDEIKRCSINENTVVGLIMGVLGRQGSTHIIDRITGELKARKIKYITLLVSEISVEQLKCFGNTIQFFVQVACPRLSIDWGKYFDKPLITPYEFYAVIGKANFSKNRYPMDYYSDNGGEWTNYYHRKKPTKKQSAEFESEPQAAQCCSKAQACQCKH